MKKTVLDFYHTVFTLSLSTSIASVLMVLLVSGSNVPIEPDTVSSVTLNIAPTEGAYTAAVAKAAGLFGKHGLHVELRVFGSEREAVDRLLAGDGTFAALSGYGPVRADVSSDTGPLEIVESSGQSGVLGSGDLETERVWVLAGTRSYDVESEILQRMQAALEEADTYLSERPLAARLMIQSVFSAGADRDGSRGSAVYAAAANETPECAILE
jgi:hypothetical protein